MPLVKRDPKELRAYANNSRKHSADQLKRIEASIKEFKFTVPVLIDEYDTIVAGHARVSAAINLGMTEIPAIVLENFTPEQIRAYVVADNRLAELSEWDMNTLAAELSEWDMNTLAAELDAIKLDFDLSLVGFENFKFPSFDETTDSDDDVPEQAAARVTIGDVWLLGDHRLMCGDATDPHAIDTLMNGTLADLAHNDPPYGMGKNIMNDNMNFNDLLDFNTQWIPLQLLYLKPNGSFYCWGTDEPLMDIYCSILKPYFNESKATFRNLLTWDKGSIAGQHSDFSRMYQPADEKCLFMMMGKQDIAQTKDTFPDEWRPLLDYLKGERDKMGWTTADVVRITGKSSASHYFTESQFAMPTQEHYAKIQQAAEGQAFTQELYGMSKEANKHLKQFRDSRAYFDGAHDNFNNVWHFQRTSNDERQHTGGHDTPKPIDLCGRVIKTSCPEEGVVIDFFGGSGSTLIACERLNRKCYMMELDPKYCDVIIARWEKVTGNIATIA